MAGRGTWQASERLSQTDIVLIRHCLVVDVACTVNGEDRENLESAELLFGFFWPLVDPLLAWGSKFFGICSVYFLNLS